MFGVGIGVGLIRRGGPALEPASATVTYNGETITLSAAAQYGYTVDGYPVIITPPGGLTIISRSTPESTRGGRVVHGAMKNPQRGLTQGWDSQQIDNGGLVEGNYSAGDKASLPITVAAGDIVVLAVSELVAVPAATNGPIVSYHPFYFVSSAPALHSFAPSAIGWAGRGTPVFRALDLDMIVGALPARSVAGMDMPTYSAILADMNRFEIAWGKFINPTVGGYETMSTRGWAAGAGAYGRYPASIIGAAGLFLVSDALTTEQKKALLTRFISHGIQSFDPAEGAGDAPLEGNGGHWQFHFLLDALYLHFMGRTAALDALHTIHPGNTLAQPFIFDAGRVADLAPHDSAVKPFTSRRRGLSAVSGTSITLATTASDAAQVSFVGLRLKRESDGASAVVVSGTDYAVVIDAQPGSPFTTSDTVYLESIDTIAVGKADWTISGWQKYNPSYDAPYRNLNFSSDELLVVRSLGIWRSAWDAMQAYTIRANRTNDPAATRDFAAHHDTVLGKTFARDFWNTYAAEVIPGPPVNLVRPSISGLPEPGQVLTAVNGTWAGSATITYTYQWLRDGAPISGATASTYTLVGGDNGTLISVAVTATNGSGSASETSVSVGPIVAYTPVAVQFDSGEKLAQTSGFTATGSKYALLALSFCCVTSIPSTQDAIVFQTSGGGDRVYLRYTSSGRLSFTATNAAGTVIAQLTCATGTIVADTWYTVIFAVDTTKATIAERMQGWIRPSGGSWANLATGAGTHTATLDGVIDNAGRCRVNNAPTTVVYYSDLYARIDETLDLAIAGNRDKFLPTVGKGANGGVPTGTTPHVYLSGSVATWHQNDGSSGGFVLTGTLTAAPSAPA